MRIHFTSITAFAAALMLAGAAQAETYTFTDLGTLGSTSHAYGINNAGQVVGTFGENNSELYHAAVWNGTTVSVLDTQNKLSAAYGINNVGQVVGRSTLGATLWQGGTASALESADGFALGINDAGQTTVVLGAAASSTGRAINASGAIVGNISVGGADHATLWQGNQVTELSTLGGTDGVASAINDAGQVVGGSSTADGSFHATLWQGTTAVDLGLANNAYSAAYGINNTGTVVGEYRANDGAYHGAIWSAGTGVDLNTLMDADAVAAGWILGAARGINDKGWIVGTAYNTNTLELHAYVLAPAVPEPATALMLLSGLCALGWGVRANDRSKR
ncbi:MAG: PEP-CTERM sorting domain-containing protein [Aquabacterium sp.]|nr:PEP-CTERM sorting domain-containing protein [Aquabacterium sp.]